MVHDKKHLQEPPRYLLGGTNTWEKNSSFNRRCFLLNHQDATTHPLLSPASISGEVIHGIPWVKSLKTSAINSYSNPIPIIPLVTSQREVVSFVVLS